MTDSAKICRADAIMGCLIAGALGDALGGPHEGAGGDTAASERALVLSDDTQLTLATCEAIQQAQGVDPEAIAAGMLRWFRAGRVTGLGASTLKALPDSGVRDRLEEFAAQIDTSDLATLATRHGASGYVVESVPLALVAVQQYAHREPAEMFTALIRCGGDTDTNASMAGQLLGTLIGRQRLPEQLVARLPQRELVESIATTFASAALGA